LVYLEWSEYLLRLIPLIVADMVADGIEEGLEWRLPKWIKVEEHETKPAHLEIKMEEMEYGQQSNDSEEMIREAKVARVRVGEEYIT
jgi:hypothetical protein